MKITLAEENTGQNSERQFDQTVILIGREPNECQVVFDNSRFSMVSRRHAELRFTEGKWILTDLGSSYGTFVDGQKISAPQIVSEGNRLQFGLQGPVMRVVRFETFSGSAGGNKEVSTIPVKNRLFKRHSNKALHRKPKFPVWFLSMPAGDRLLILRKRMSGWDVNRTATSYSMPMP